MSDDSAGRIVDALRSWVAAAPPGAQLPSTRALVAQHGASPVTVHRAVTRLSALGLVETRPGVGTFTTTTRRSRPADFSWQTTALGAGTSADQTLSSTQRDAGPDAIALHSGYPGVDLLPERMVRSALVRAARSRAALSRSPVAGMPELQAWFAGQVAAEAPVGVTPPSPRDVIVTAGSQSSLSSIFRALVGAGRPLVVESPTYWGALLAARQTGVTLVPVSTGPEGPDPDDVDRALASTGSRAFYCQPTYANPVGTQWSPRVAAAVLDVARRRGAYLIEDDWARDLAIDTEPRTLASRDDDGHVVYLRSLTKSVSPALRVAGLVARGPARDRILADRAAETMYVSGVLQAAALDVVTQPGWSTHLRGLRRDLRDRRDLLLEMVAVHAPRVEVERAPVGGLNLWVRLPDGTDVDELVRRAESAGLLIAAGREWFPAEPAGQHARLNFAGDDPARFAEAARILARALADVS